MVLTESRDTIVCGQRLVSRLRSSLHNSSGIGKGLCPLSGVTGVSPDCFFPPPPLLAGAGERGGEVYVGSGAWPEQTPLDIVNELVRRDTSGRNWKCG